MCTHACMIVMSKYIIHMKFIKGICFFQDLNGAAINIK